jgi:AcrR family transcriptional regulator
VSVEDWLQAGYTVLAEQGVRALKVERLCQHLGVTRGSFYWHFENMDGYRAALVESWIRSWNASANPWLNSTH